MQPTSPSTLCRAPACSKKIARGYVFYCAEHRDLLIGHLTKTIDSIMGEAREVYLGRSAHPERRLLEHHAGSGRDHLAVLHWAADWDEAERTETLVIDAYMGRKLKLRNESAEPVGRHSGPWGCIYASWSWKARAKPLTMRPQAVLALDWRRRLHPDPAVPKAVDYLHTPLSQADAGQVVDAWWASLRGR